MIKFRKVTKTFETGQTALKAVNLDIKPGEFSFVVGPSGAGKTTLLRLIIRDLIPSKGEVVVDNLKLSRLPAGKIPHLRRNVGMIFQDFKLLMDKTVYENVSLPLEILGEKQDKIKKKVLDVLEMVGLAEKAEHFPVQLSAGETQRVSLARAVVGEPKIVLADEPTGNLDPKTSWEIIDDLKKIHKQGRTVIVATHDQDIVNSLKERVISIDDGKVTKDESKGKYS